LNVLAEESTGSLSKRVIHHDKTLICASSRLLKPLFYPELMSVLRRFTADVESLFVCIRKDFLALFEIANEPEIKSKN
jgi:hypothetical protein